MAALNRTRTSFTGFPGGPGVATMYFRDVTTAFPSLHALWNGFAQFMPEDVHINMLPTGDILEETTGEIIDQWSAGTWDEITGSQTGGYSAPSGFQVRWDTTAILDGRRLHGRTFIVPAGNTVYSTGGTLVPTVATDLQSVIDGFINDQSASFSIWHRPREAKEADGSRPAVTARAGGSALVTNGRVVGKAAVLRSRRD